MKSLAVSLIAVAVVGGASAGCGSKRRHNAPSGTTTGAASSAGGTTTTTPPALAGSYLGSYASTGSHSDRGVIGVIVFPDLSFSAIAVSEVDEDIRETAQGSLAADGTIHSAVTGLGSVFTLDLARMEGTYLSNVSAGTFTLRRAPTGGAAGCYFGTTTNVTLGITGWWMGIVDERDRLFAVYYYPYPWPTISEGVYGTAVPDGQGGWTLNAGNTSNTVNGTGRLDAGGWFSGSWNSPSQGQSGTWTGTRHPY